jgi:hypothetical protein
VNHLRTALPWILVAALAAVSWLASATAGLLASKGSDRADRWTKLEGGSG